MQKVKGLFLLLIFTFLLIGCQLLSNEKVTIEPYKLNEQESELVSKTGIEQIEFFKLNGTLKEEEDLQFTVELFEDGEFKEWLLKTADELEPKFNDSLISFGISGFADEDHSLKIITGITSGHVTTNYPNHMTASSFSQLLNEKITLEKNKPIYLAAWIGTTQDRLRSVVNENGELPEGIEEAEVALLYKVLLTDRE